MNSRINFQSRAPRQNLRALVLRAAVIAGMLIFCLALLAWGQSRQVSGRVTTTEDGSPLPGVNVIVKGTATGTPTDRDGRYTLSVEPEAVLSFSFVGFHSQEVEVGEREVVDVALEADARQLSEIVITDSGVPTEKRKLAVSVESLKAKDIPQVPTQSIDQALVGKIPGALISSIDGTPGSEVAILLRTINTLNRGTTPMIMVDGVQMAATTLSYIDPNSVEKVEVTQGAASSTIYGAQGANGVIQIFTKKGGQGKFSIDISSGYTQSEQLNIGPLRKAAYHGFSTDATGQVIGANGLPVVQSPYDLVYRPVPGFNLLSPTSKWDKPYGNPNIRNTWPGQLNYFDHFKMFLRPANIYNLSASVASSSENADYYFLISRNHHQSNFSGDGYNDRTNLVANIGTEITRALELRLVSQLIYTKNTIHLFQSQDEGLGQNSYWLFQTRPFADYTRTDTDGDYGAIFGGAAGVNGANPLYLYQYSDTESKRFDIFENLSLKYRFTKLGTLEALYGINWYDDDLRFVVQNQSENNNSNAFGGGVYVGTGPDNTGQISDKDSKRMFQNFKVGGTLVLNFESDLGVSFPLVSTTHAFYDYRSDRLHTIAVDAFGMPMTPPLTAARATTVEAPQDNQEDFVTFGYFVSQRFDYKEIAGISGGFRTDWSSAFGEGTKPFTFPRADGYLRISEFPSWQGSGISKAILEWKIRSAYGEAGIQPRPFDRQITLSTRTLGDNNSMYFERFIQNPYLDVEVSRELEIGTDIVFESAGSQWLTSTSLSATYWKRWSDDVIFDHYVPPSSGILAFLDNSISLESEGIQASLNLNLYRSPSLQWNLTTNLGTQKTIISDVKGGLILAGDRILVPGQQVGQQFGYRMLHSLTEQKPDGEFFISPTDTANYEVASNGWVVNKATKQPFISDEQYSLGDPNPDFVASFINDLSFKRGLVTFSAQFDWVKGGRLYNNTKQWMYRDGIHSDYEVPFEIGGETGAWSAFYRGAYNPDKWYKNYFYEDASFVRLRNISVGIDLARIGENKIKPFRRCQLIVTGRNLLTWTRYSGLDPEINTYAAPNQFTGASALSRGIDDNNLGNFRSYQINLFLSI